MLSMFRHDIFLITFHSNQKVSNLFASQIHVIENQNLEQNNILLEVFSCLGKLVGSYYWQKQILKIPNNSLNIFRFFKMEVKDDLVRPFVSFPIIKVQGKVISL